MHKKLLWPRRSLVALICLVCVASTSWADVNLEWRQQPGDVYVNNIVKIGLYAVSDDPGSSQWVSGMEIIFVWDPEYLDFLGNDDTGIPYQWVGFPPRWPSPDGYGLNEAIPPKNGDGLHMAYAGFPPLPQASPEGLLVTTFEFLALKETTGTTLSIVETRGSPETNTVVWGGMAGQIITGDLGQTTVIVEDGTDEFEVTVQLEGVTAAELDRCITFELRWCGIGPTCGQAEPVIVEESITFLNGVGTTTFHVPCAEYTCIAARDPLHTLQRVIDSTSSHWDATGTAYVVSFVEDNSVPRSDPTYDHALGDALVGGNLNDMYNGYIDAIDFALLIGQFGTWYDSDGDTVYDGNTPCGHAFTTHADFSGNGRAWAEDYTFIQLNHALLGEIQADDGCCGDKSGDSSRRGPVLSITVEELRSLGYPSAVAADLDADGWVDDVDMELWMQGVRPTLDKPAVAPRNTGENSVKTFNNGQGRVR